MVDKILPSYPLRTYKAIYDMELIDALKKVIESTFTGCSLL